MKASAPNLLAAGFQVGEKIFTPSVLNHNAACWLVETAIRTSITSTSRPHASARNWKLRSPSGRRWARGWAGPAGTAGPARSVTVLTVTTPSDPSASQCSRRRLLLNAPAPHYSLRGGSYAVILLSCALAFWSRLEGSGA